MVSLYPHVVGDGGAYLYRFNVFVSREQQHKLPFTDNGPQKSSLQYLYGMQSAITIQLLQSELDNFHGSILRPVLEGILPKTGPLPEDHISCIAVEILDETGENVDSRPPMLIPGFVGFAKNLFDAFPDFIYVADIFHDFYRHAIIAASCDMTAVESGKNRTVFVDAEAYIQRAQAELRHFEQLCAERCDFSEVVYETHQIDLAEYLFKS